MDVVVGKRLRRSEAGDSHQGVAHESSRKHEPSRQELLFTNRSTVLDRVPVYRRAQRTGREIVRLNCAPVATSRASGRLTCRSVRAMPLNALLYGH